MFLCYRISQCILHEMYLRILFEVHCRSNVFQLNRNKSFQKQTIFVQRQAKEEPEECRVIQTDDLLLQNIKTKRYFRAHRHELEYVNIPDRKELK